MTADSGTGPGLAALAERFAGLYAGADMHALASNLHGPVAMLDAGGMRLPATLGVRVRGNAWVCSPRTAYVDYAAEEARRLLAPWLARATGALCAVLGPLLDRCALDHAVTLNNWGLSTNLYPPLAQVDLDHLLRQCRQRWPDRAIWLRSLNAQDTPDWLQALRRHGAVLVPSRQVYLFDGLDGPPRHRDLARDLRLLARTDLQAVDDADIVEADYPRIAALYAMLYLDKYSPLNPAYTPAMLRDWHRHGLLRLRGFRERGGALLCVAGMFGHERTLTTPIVGYDTTRPQRLALYRSLTACSFQAAGHSRRRLNLSAGAAGFKRLRGGVPAIEYSAVLAGHCPPRTRAALAVLAGVATGVGVPLMRRYQL